MISGMDDGSSGVRSIFSSLSFYIYNEGGTLDKLPPLCEGMKVRMLLGFCHLFNVYHISVHLSFDGNFLADEGFHFFRI